MLYRKRPVIVEAVQWTGKNFKEMDKFINQRFEYYEGSETLVIHTLEGDLDALPGDWIVRGVRGEFYPCKPDIFDMTYEPVDELSEPESRALFVEGITRHMQ